MPKTRFVATLAETAQMLRSFLTQAECRILVEEPAAAKSDPALTTRGGSVEALSIREQDRRRWMPPLLIWPAGGEERTRVAWKKATDGGMTPQWAASSPSLRFRFPEETVDGRILKLGWGEVEWAQEYSGDAPPPKLRSLYTQLVARLRRSTASYVLKRRLKIGKEARRMVLEGEAKFLWQGGWFPKG
jgi:hypothetical protein